MPKALLEKIAAEIVKDYRIKAEVTSTDEKPDQQVYKKHTLHVATPDGEYQRKLFTVICPPTRWPVKVEHFHCCEKTLQEQVTTYQYEWGINPNVGMPDVGALSAELKNLKPMALAAKSPSHQSLAAQIAELEAAIEKLPDYNPPTIDDRDELEKVLRGILGLEATKKCLRRLG